MNAPQAPTGANLPPHLPPAGPPVRPPNVPPKMTLRRFVRTTFDNFRQLIQSIAAPGADLPMPVLVTAPKPNGAAPTAGQPHPVEPTRMQSDSLGAGSPKAGTPHESTHAGTALPPTAAAVVTSTADEPITMAGVATADDAETADAAEVVAAEVVAAATTPSTAAAADIDTGASKDALDAEHAADDEHTEEDSAPAPSLTLAAALESLLFVSDEAVEPAHLARALAIPAAEVEAGLLALDAAYRTGGRGLRLQTRNGRYQLVTAPEAANLIETFLNLDTSAKLSAPALETLAVVAYRQPVTRAQIEAVRGVDCSGVLRSLLQRGLLEEVGRLDAPGRPVLYGVTDLFMHHFGLTALHELPPLETTELARIEEAIEQQP